jgi:nuclear transport factor 2 (NTF2) superfamily protein
MAAGFVRKFIALPLLLALLAGQEISASEHQDELLDFAHAYTEAWNSGDPEQVANCYTQDGRLTINGGTPYENRAGVVAAAQGFMQAFPDLELLFDGLEPAGDRIRYHWTLIGTNTGPEGTGRRVEISGYEAWILSEEGLIQDSLGHYDAEDYARQLREGPLPQ